MMNIMRSIILSILISLWLLPGVADARTGTVNFQYFDSLYSRPPGATGQMPVSRQPSTQVPDPKATQVQVFIFKKSTVIWNQPVPGLPAMFPGAAPGKTHILVKDPQLNKLIQKYAQKHGVDPKLVQALIRQESGFNALAISPKGAMGLMQLMPETAASLGVEDPFNVEQNIRGGVQFLKSCLNRFEQNLPLALAAYNAGPGRVVEHQGMPPFKETHTYVKNIVQAYSGQTLDPAQVKLGQLAAAPVPEKQAANPVQPAAQAVPPPPLDLTTFAISSPEKMGAFLSSEKTAPKQNEPLSLF